MALTRATKERMVQELGSNLSEVKGFILVQFKGMSFTEMSDVRQEVKALGGNFQVVKNTLLSIALDKQGIDIDKEVLTKSTALMTAMDEFPSVAKVAKTVSSSSDFFKVKYGYFDGTVLTAGDVLTIASLPSKDELLATTLATMIAPTTHFVSLFANIERGLLNVLNGIKEQKA